MSHPTSSWGIMQIICSYDLLPLMMVKYKQQFLPTLAP